MDDFPTMAPGYKKHILREVASLVNGTSSPKAEADKAARVGETCSTWPAYVLWLPLFNLFWPGCHLYYLGRDLQCFLYMITFGGFGLAWARDIVRIPAYVAEYNGVKTSIPNFHLDRIFALLFFGIWFGFIFSAIPPKGYSSKVYLACSWVGNALGMYLCSCCFSKHGTATKTFRGALIWGAWGVMPFLLTGDEEEDDQDEANTKIRGAVLLCAMIACFGVYWNRDHTPTPNPPVFKAKSRGHCRRFSTLMFFLVLYFSLCSLTFYQHGSIPYDNAEDGESSYMDGPEVFNNIGKFGEEVVSSSRLQLNVAVVLIP
jgi:hypothetical protein